MNLSDKVVIVTGASRGIGLAAAQKLADLEARVYGVARTMPAKSEIPDGISMLRCDVRERTQVEQVVHTVLDETDRIDILVSNAGFELVKPLVEMTDEEYEKVLNTNLKGAFLFVRAILPTMQRQRAGQLIFINSVSGVRGFAEDAVYCASKFGLTGLADALDEELRAQGVRITSIHPGATDTTFAYDSWSPPDDPRRSFFLKAEDVSEAIVYAASQPAHVVVKQIVIQPVIELPHSDFLPLDVVKSLGQKITG